MKERFMSLEGSLNVPVTFGTFHAVFFTILRHAYNYSVNSIITRDLQYNFIRDKLISFELEYSDENEMVNSILSQISKVKNDCLNIDEYISTACPDETFRIIYKEYGKMLISRRLIDYDDMVVLCNELLTQRADYKAAWQDKYKYILIDEFQDINKMQFDTIKLIAGESANIFAVGDDDQSIYGFRGSKPDIMLAFKEYYSNAEIINLNVNYRCTDNIVKAARSLIGNNSLRYYKNIKSAGMVGECIQVQEAKDIHSLKKMLSDSIKKLIEDGIEPSDIAVISRTNSINGIYYSRLIDDGIPCISEKKQENIYDYWAVKDMLAYIKVSKGKCKREDILRIVNKPLRYIKRTFIKEPFSYEQLRASYENNAEMINIINDWQFDMNIIKNMSPYAAVNYIIKGIGYEEYYKEYILTHRINGTEAYDKIEEFKEMAKKFDTIDNWLEYINNNNISMNNSKNAALVENIKASKNSYPQDNDNAVHFHTMHSCKGLEYKVVFIMDVVEGIIPYNKAVLDYEIEEERRLMYVAMTRAKEKLYLLYAKSRYNKDTTISRFVTEIDDHYVDYSFSESSCS